MTEIRYVVYKIVRCDFMANYVFHTIKAEGLRDKLISGGFVKPDSLYSSREKEFKQFDNVLDYEKCDAEECRIQREKILEKGILDYKTSPPTRRDYSPEEAGNISKYAIQFSDDGNEVHWFTKYRTNDDPVFYISKAFPDDIFYFCKFYESEYDGSYYVKDGVACDSKGKTITDILYVNKHCMGESEKDGYHFVNLTLDEDGHRERVYVPSDSINYTGDIAAIYFTDELCEVHDKNTNEKANVSVKDIIERHNVALNYGHQDYIYPVTTSDRACEDVTTPTPVVKKGVTPTCPF